jgi:hypothetical protein
MKAKLATRRMAGVALFLSLCAIATPVAWGQKSDWRPATDTELAALLPARAPVEKEHIETEMRTANGITDGKGRFIAGVILITAGYSADGKYSHYLVAQTPIRIGGVNLPAGQYVFGWQKEKDGESLSLHFHEALTGKLIGNAQAHKIVGTTRVESLRIWPPSEKEIIQIGRYMLPYELEEDR